MHFLHLHELKKLRSIIVAKLITTGVERIKVYFISMNHLIWTEVVEYSSNAFISAGILYDNYQYA